MAGFRNYGPNVSRSPTAIAPGSGNLSEDDHSWELVVFEFDKPPLDWEWNLFQGILGNAGARISFQKQVPSSFLTSDFLERPDILGSYSLLAADPPAATTANTFQLRAADVNVNGWLIRLDLTNSGTLGFNNITLPTPPVGAGTSRVDLVVLEVWRALIRPAPNGTNKSVSGQVLRYGNAKAPDGAPLGNQNLADDLIDTTLAQETSSRVQIQYRLRAISGVTIATYPDGLDDPAMVAHTVPYQSASGVDGAATILTFSKSAVDPGLWVAGSNDAAGVTALGTVDGLMYAIPVCAVFRRNSAAFDRATNLNGAGLMATSVSGRPDGLYADQVVAGDIKDLRKGQYREVADVLQKAFQQVLDNTLSTEHEFSSAGPCGTSFLSKDDILQTGSPHPFGADGVRRFFSDRSVSETIVAKVVVGGAVSSVNFDLPSLTLSWASSPVNLANLAPAGTNIVQVNSVRVVDFVGNTDHDAFTAVAPFVSNITYGVATGPQIDRATVNFNANISNVTVYAELVVEYPAGFGLKRNLISGTQLWAPIPASMPVWVDTTGWTATSDANRDAVVSSQWWVDPGHREVAIRLHSTSQTAVFNTYATDRLLIWERLDGGTITINDGTNPPYTTTNYTFNTAYTTVVLSGAASIIAGHAVTVTYKAFRAAPALGAPPADSYNFFYQTRAIQSIVVPAGGQTLGLIPRNIMRTLSVLTTGSGSPDDAFPFFAPSAQLPVGTLPGFAESKLDAPNVISNPTMTINTGYLEIPASVPYMPDPSAVTLYKAAPDTTIDGDGRNFWPKSDDGTAQLYSPVVFGQPFIAKQRHKVCFPAIMELKQDFASIGRKGTLVLVVFTKWFEYDDQVGVALTSTLSDSAAAVYRVRGNLLNPRRSDV